MFEKTVEHIKGYFCKNLCHAQMRCADFPDAEKVCGSKDSVDIPDSTIEFLKSEVEKVVGEKLIEKGLVEKDWASRTNEVIESKKTASAHSCGFVRPKFDYTKYPPERIID
jgi:hypothetical protein